MVSLEFIVIMKRLYKKVFFFLLLTSCFFTACAPEYLEPEDEIAYTTPDIINENLDIGLFSPFEVPLVQEREYEFTATTDYKYVKVHFVNPEKGDRWISLRKIENLFSSTSIFSQNLIIPKGTTRVEIGISNRANAKDNDVEIYAVYNKVYTLEQFKSVIDDEEFRRERDEDPFALEGRVVLESYEKITIDRKYTTKYPKSLKRGETYRFEIGPFDSSYCIFNTCNDDTFSWLPVEKNEDKKFVINYQIPSDAQTFRIVLSSTSTTFIESLVSFDLVGEIDRSKKSRIEDDKTIVISSSSMSNLNIPVDDEKIYKVYVDSSASVNNQKYKYCLLFCNNIYGESLDFFVLDKVDDKYETNCFYVPQGTDNISVYLSNDYFYSSNKIANINVSDLTSQNPLNPGKNVKKTSNYKSEEPDEDLVNYLDIRDARKLGNDNPDALVDICIDYIEKNSLDDFHKMKLLHDTLWYLASYDWDSLNIGDYKPWDFRTVLSRGLCVCAGYSRTFVYFCDRMGIRAINVLGTGLKGTERTIEEVEDQNHAWTMVELSDGWYLLDVTWDCSNTTNGIRDNMYSCNFFIVDPEEFIKTHYPLNPEKQLIDTPYSSAEILSLLRSNK